MELIVGSEDYMIRAFANEEIIFEINETGMVTDLVNLHKSKFVFALKNGSCGVYDGNKRLWRLKGKYKATAILGVVRKDLNLTCVIIGWENGKVEVKIFSFFDDYFKD